MTTIAFATLGCRANQYQTELLKAQLTTHDSQLTTFDNQADIYVINTCTVTLDADRTSRKLIRKALKQNPQARIIVAGCYAKLQQTKLKELFPQIEFLTPAYSLPPTVPAPQIRANLMIQDGCDNFCSYCIVPYARGPLSSKPQDQILSEAEALVKAGAREIILSGINLGKYQNNLPLLVTRLSLLPQLLRLRLSSIEPMYLTKELIDTMARTTKACHHLHMPLQSGDSSILNKMNRNYTSADYVKLIDYVRSQMPDCAITTDIIVGFPGETDKQFQETLELVKQIKFSRIHVFSYSKRPGTPAADFPDQVDPAVKKERNKQLHQLRNRYMKEFAKTYQNKEVEIMVESTKEGLTGNYIRVRGSFDKKDIGQLVKVDSRKWKIKNR